MEAQLAIRASVFVFRRLVDPLSIKVVAILSGITRRRLLVNTVWNRRELTYRSFLHDRA